MLNNKLRAVPNETYKGAALFFIEKKFNRVRCSHLK